MENPSDDLISFLLEAEIDGEPVPMPVIRGNVGQMLDEPELIPTAAEDTMLGDREVKEGERIMLTFPSANRDPEMFENPEKVIIDRQRNRHVAFGSGIHHCAGSNLARMEMNVAIEEFLKMVPEFELADPDAVAWAGGQVRGPHHLPVVFPSRTAL